MSLTTDFAFTDGVPVMKIPASDESAPNNTCYMYSEHMKYGDLLYDLKMDPEQNHPIKDSEIEQHLKEEMIKLLKINEAPSELYDRLDLHE